VAPRASAAPATMAMIMSQSDDTLFLLEVPPGLTATVVNQAPFLPDRY
jgi:hypothetical protein